MAEIFRGLIETRIARPKRVDHGDVPPTIALTTPTEYTVGSSLEWPTPPYVDREQPQAYGVPIHFIPEFVPILRNYTLMGQACL